MIRDVNANHAELMSGVDMSIHEPTNDVYVHSLEPVATLRDFPAMPNLAAEHIAAVRRHLNGGRTTAELDELARRAWLIRIVKRLSPEDIRSIRMRYDTGET